LTVSQDFANSYLVDIVRMFKNYKALGDAALAQLSDTALHTTIDPDSNSAAVIVKHVAGNLRSRLGDFLNSDGEKPERDRDAEFEVERTISRAEILRWWESGWTTAFRSLEALTPADLARTVTIRREPFGVVEALNRIATHTAYHVGQIVFLAKHLSGSQWKTLSIPKGQSRSYATGTFKQGIIPNEKQEN
jgi:hypothetical protein